MRVSRTNQLRRAGAWLAALAAVTAASGCGPAEDTGTAASAIQQRTRASDALAVGYRHACLVRTGDANGSGGVRCWGDNNFGQLGDGTVTDRNAPVAVSGLTPQVLGVATGTYHTCALQADGTVRCWGSDSWGQLGEGVAGGSSTTPVSVAGLTQVTQVVAGAYHTCALRSDGTARCWGYGPYGQLGNGATQNAATPQVVSGLSDAIALAAGGDATCALRANGAVSCWGQAFVDGATFNSATPNAISGLTNAVAIEVGYGHACAIVSGGGVRCWGYNTNGELGDAASGTTTTPVTVAGVSNAIALTAGDDYSCAVLADGYARCWGTNGAGQLGDGSVGPGGAAPVAVTSLSLANAISAGRTGTCALRSGGDARCWGNNTFGQLGDGTNTDSASPVMVQGASRAQAQPRIAAGDSHACLLDGAGSVRCWGTNASGQLGTGAVGGDSSVPVAAGILYMTDVAAGSRHTCALRQGYVWCWGSNSFGQLGDGTTIDHASPEVVSGISTAVAITAAGSHTCALLANGTAQCWGYNGYGQLGNGSTTNSSTPVSVIGALFPLASITAIEAGSQHTCALLANGTARCWGRNAQGQLGDATNVDRTTPVSVSGLTGARAITAGGSHSCAVLSSGGVRCWGNNASGQLGDASNVSTNTPVVVAALSDATDVAAGSFHTCATRANGGRVRCWGRGTSGQLGNAGNYTDSNVPVTVSTAFLDLANQSALAAGGSFSCSTSPSGTANCWGANTSGQLGTGDYAGAAIPRAVFGLP